MASKKGIALTAGILAAVTGASFLIWLVPQNNPQSIVVSDFEKELDSAKEIHQTIEQSIDEEFQKMLDGQITPDEFIQIAQISSSQISAEIILLVESGAPSEWQESYLNYLEALRTFNSYIREAIVVANLKLNDAEDERIQESLENLEELKNEYESLAEASDEVRP